MQLRDHAQGCFAHSLRRHQKQLFTRLHGAQFDFQHPLQRDMILPQHKGRIITPLMLDTPRTARVRDQAYAAFLRAYHALVARMFIHAQERGSQASALSGREAHGPAVGSAHRTRHHFGARMQRHDDCACAERAHGLKALFGAGLYQRTSGLQQHERGAREEFEHRRSVQPRSRRLNAWCTESRWKEQRPAPSIRRCEAQWIAT